MSKSVTVTNTEYTITNDEIPVSFKQGMAEFDLIARAEKAEAALTAEREKVRVLRDAMTRLQGYCDWVIPPHDRICAIARAALAATKEASQ